MEQVIRDAGDAAPACAQSGLKSETDQIRRGRSDQMPYVVLYIEDNYSNLKLIERVIRDRPAVQLITALDGLEGLALARKQQPDLVLLDLHLPDISGYEVIRQLREDEQLHDTAIVVISADAMGEQIERLLSAGAREYLTKPIDVGYFLKLLDYLVIESGRRQTVELPRQNSATCNRSQTGD